MKFFICTLIGISGLLCPLISSADYVIHLKNGRQIVTSEYWQQGKKVFVQTAYGVVEFKKDAVRTIDEKDVSNEVRRPAQTNISNEVQQPTQTNISNEVQRPAQTNIKTAKATQTSPDTKKEKEISLEEYKQKKEDIKVDIETVLARYREALSNHDRKQQELLRQELTGLSKQIYDINDTVIARNKGVLPEGWTQE